MGVQYSITYFPFVLGRIFLWVLRNLWHKILEADVVDILDDRLLHTDPLQLKKKKGAESITASALALLVIHFELFGVIYHKKKPFLKKCFNKSIQHVNSMKTPVKILCFDWLTFAAPSCRMRIRLLLHEDERRYEPHHVSAQISISVTPPTPPPFI